MNRAKKEYNTENTNQRPLVETGRGWPPKPDNLQSNPQKKVFKDKVHNEQQNNTENKANKAHARAKIIRNMNNTQHTSDKAQEPEVYKMKWKYVEIMRIGSTNIKIMRDPVKREKIILQMERHSIDIMCLQETKIPDSCFEIKKGFTFVFSLVSTIREHWGVGICYRNYMETHRNYYKQNSSNIMAMEINMHGNPIIRISTYIHTT